MTAIAGDTLTDRQLRFIFEYLIDQNASAAALRAGYSEKSRASAAHDLMNNPAVQARLREELQSLLAELRCSALALMKERMRAAFFRAEKMFKSGWEMLDLDQMEPETRAALEVRSVSRKSGPVLHIRQPDRDKALRALEKVHERLERLNEKYWARLEKEGKVKSLAEIEAMDGGGAEPSEQVEAARADAPAGDFSPKAGVFLGSGAAVADEGLDFSAQAMVFLGAAAGGEGTGGEGTVGEAAAWLAHVSEASEPGVLTDSRGGARMRPNARHKMPEPYGRPSLVGASAFCAGAMYEKPDSKRRLAAQYDEARKATI